MCDPVSITMAAVSIASTAAAAQGQAEAAHAAQVSARDGFLQNQIAVGIQQQQQSEQASQQLSARALEAVRQRGRLAAIAADMGDGTSIDRQFGEVAMNAANDGATTRANLANMIQQGQLQKAGLRAHAASTINQAVGPSDLATGLQIAGAVAGGYASNGKLVPQQKLSALAIPTDPVYGFANGPMPY